MKSRSRNTRIRVFDAVHAYLIDCYLLQLFVTPCQKYKNSLSVFEELHTWCKSHYIWTEGNLSPSIFSHMFTAGWNHTSCIMCCFGCTVWGQKDFWNFIASYANEERVSGCLTISLFLYFTLRLRYCLWTVSIMMVGCLPPTLFLHECYTRLVSKHCWLSYMLQLLYFYSV